MSKFVFALLFRFYVLLLVNMGLAMYSPLSLTQKLFLADRFDPQATWRELVTNKSSAQDRFSLLPDDTDFVFDFNQPAPGGAAGGIVVANRKTFPPLVGTGSSMAVGWVGPCGVNTFYIHPRATELQIVVEGRLVTEMNPENGVLNANGTRRVIQAEIGALQMIPFYQGSIHTQFNPDCTNATFVSYFSSEDFGTEQAAEGLFAFSDDVIAASLGQAVKAASIEILRAAIPPSIAVGVSECVKKCGLEA